MKYLVILIVSLSLAVVLGHFISDDAGFVVIGYAGKVFRTSFAFFVVLLVVAIIALYFTWRFLYQVLTLKTRWIGWSGEYRRKRSQRTLSNGLIALAEGDFTRAERLLSRGEDDETTPAIRYLGAAEAAQALNASERRDTYLSLAHDAMPSAEVAVGTKRAEMQLANDQSGQARVTLDYLADRHPDNKQVLSLQQRVYTETNDTRALLGLLPALRRHRVYAPERLAELESETASALLSQPVASVDELHDLWQRLPKTTRSRPVCVALYAKQLAAFGHHEDAELVVRKILGREWHAELIRQYGDVSVPKALQQMQRAEVWQVTRMDDLDLLLTLAKLSINADQWGKARKHLDRLIVLAPSPMAYRLLAEVHEHAEESDEAIQCQREGLRLATNAVGGLPAVRAVSVEEELTTG